MRLQTHESSCIAHHQLVENLQKELDARQAVIQDLQAHWLRAEEACRARLTVIEKLEAQQQQREARFLGMPRELLALFKVARGHLVRWYSGPRFKRKWQKK
jgi:hypothetical protein